MNKFVETPKRYLTHLLNELADTVGVPINQLWLVFGYYGIMLMAILIALSQLVRG